MSGNPVKNNGVNTFVEKDDCINSAIVEWPLLFNSRGFALENAVGLRRWRPLPIMPANLRSFSNKEISTSKQ
jgi:hypothetical protein